jgi:hypothetical protein
VEFLDLVSLHALNPGRFGSPSRSQEDSEQYSSARHFSGMFSREEGKNASESSANVDVQTGAESKGVWQRRFGQRANEGLP